MPASNLTVTPLGDGRFIVGDGTSQRTAYAVAAQDATWVFLDGHVYVVETEATSSRRPRGADDQAAPAAPMPATVVLVNVTPGQEVAPGDLLIMLEAMKMELPIKATRAGRVKTIACHQGELVQPGVPLLELE